MGLIVKNYNIQSSRIYSQVNIQMLEINLEEFNIQIPEIQHALW